MRILKSTLLISLSVICSTGVLAQDGLISIDNITHDYGPGCLSTGGTHEVSIRYDLFANQPPGDPPLYWVGSNGFEIYSPDGANWGYLQGSRGPLVVTADGRSFISVWEKHFYFDGTVWTQTGDGGLDPAPGSGGIGTRAGFFLATFDVMTDGGYIGGLDDDIALTLEFQTLHADSGLHICIDTCDQITAWEWTNGDEDFPIWDNGLGVDGPRCWELVFIPNKSRMGPDWCMGQTSDALMVGSCTQASYWLCAESYIPSGCDAVSPTFTFSTLPPYNDGNHGSVDPTSGQWTWSGPTVQPGAYSIEFQAFDGTDFAPTPFVLEVLVTGDGCECVGRVGDANCSGDDEPTIGDIAYMIDRKFIMLYPPAPFCNLSEADINQSGNPIDLTESDVTIGDISILIDYLFITGPELGLNDCL